MPESSIANESKRAMLPWVPMFAAVFIVSTIGVSWFLVGDLSTVEPSYADYLWRPSTLLQAHETLIGLVSILVLAMSGVALVAACRAGRLRAPLLGQLVVLVLFAAWLGLGYRVMTAGVIGANFGAGGVLLLTPVLAIVSCGVVAGVSLRSRRP